MANGEFWLPSEFLTDDDILTDKENLNKSSLNASFGSNFVFPSEFPYEFRSYGSSSVLSSPVESVVGSTETESDEDELLTGLTRQLVRSKIAPPTPNLEKSWILSGSPQSTLSAAGSWSNGPSQVPSPPATPLGGNNDAWDLIYAAAGQVARLKMNGEGPPKGRGLLGTPRILTPVQHPSPPPVKNPNNGFSASHCLSHNFSQTNHFGLAAQDELLKQQCSAIWGRPTTEGLISQNKVRVIGGGGISTPPSAWPPLQVRHQNNQNQPPPQHGGSGTRAVFLGGSGAKRGCAGTGVFLPRRYGINNPSESRRKPGCSTALLPARVVQALNKNLDTMIAQSQAQARFNAAFIPDYDSLMARRNAAMLNQQRRGLRAEGGMGHDLCLPQEWTY